MYGDYNIDQDRIWCLFPGSHMFGLPNGWLKWDSLGVDGGFPEGTHDRAMKGGVPVSCSFAGEGTQLQELT